jgi:REP element-mobilizing transposase RayT
MTEDLYSHCNQPVFITIRAFQAFSPFKERSLCTMAIDTLHEMVQKHGFQLHAYSLLPDHLHYLVNPKDDGISVLEFTNQLKGKTTNSSWKLGWSGKLWQPRY